MTYEVNQIDHKQRGWSRGTHVRRAYGTLPRPALALLRKGLAPAAAHLPTPLGFVRALVACTLGVSATLLLDFILRLH